MRKSQPPSFIKIVYVVDGVALDKILIHKSNLQLANLKNIGSLKWKDTDNAPFLIAKGNAAEFFKKIL